MPFALHQGVRIHYEVEGQGPPLVLQHSLARSLEMWRDFRYTEELKKDYQLILIDTRGHGSSDKPHDLEAYGADLMVGDLLAVLDDLGVESAHHMGFSLGARIGWHIPRTALFRFHSLILMGVAQYGRLTGRQKQFRAQLQRSLELSAEKGPEEALAAAERASGQSWPPEVRARFLATDYQALLACLKASEEWPGAGDILPSITVPCLVIVGDADGAYSDARECARQMPRVTFVTLPGVAHNPAQYRADLVLPHVKRFLAEVASESEPRRGVRG